MKLNLGEIKTKTLPILKEAGATRSSLFGSYVKGMEKSTSDVDILVELPEHLSLLDIVDLKLKLESALKKKVDLVEYKAIRPELKESILSHQIALL